MLTNRKRRNTLDPDKESVFDLKKLFKENIEESIKTSKVEELRNLRKYLSKEFIESSRQKMNSRMNFPKVLDNFKFIKIENIDYIQEDPEFFQKLKLIKIVNELQLIFFISNNQKVLIYDRCENVFILDKLKKGIVSAIDYDAKNNVLIFGHNSGKIRFYKWKNNELVQLRNIKTIRFTKLEIEKIKFICSVDLIIIFDQKSVILLHRTKDVEVKYKKILISNNNRFSDFDFTQINKFSEKEKIVKICIILGFVKYDKADFFCFDISYNDEKFHTIDLIKSFSIANENSKVFHHNFIQEILPESKSEETLKIKPKILFQKRQWKNEDYENHDYAVIIWGNVLQKFHITPEIEFKDIFKLKLKHYVKSAFFGSIELLYLLYDNYELYNIDFTLINQNNQNLTIKNTNECNNSESKVDSFIVSNTTRVFIGKDTMKKSICIFTDLNLQYFQILSWKNYYENLKFNSKYPEALYLLINIARGVNCKLNGVMLTEYLSPTFTPGDIDQNNSFKSDLKEASLDLTTEISQWYLKKGGVHLMKLNIELLAKTNNQHLITNDLMNLVIDSELEDDRLITQFFQQVSIYLDEGIIDINFNKSFFAKVLNLHTKNPNLIVKEFIYFLLKKFKFEKDTLDFFKLIIFNKNLHEISLLFLLYDPVDDLNIKYFFEKIGFNYNLLKNLLKLKTENQLFQKISEQLNLENFIEHYDLKDPEIITLVSTLQNEILRVFIYIHDLFTIRRFFETDSNNRMKHSLNDFKLAKKKTRKKFLEMFPLFLEMYPKISIWLLYNIHNSYLEEDINYLISGFNDDNYLISGFNDDNYLISGFNDDNYLISGFNDDNYLISGFNDDYNKLFFSLLNSRKSVSFCYLLLCIFYLENRQSKFNQLFTMDFFTKLLDYENLKELQSKIDFEYLFNFLYEFYYRNRLILSENKKFQTFLIEHQNLMEIYKVLLNDINEEFADNFEIYIKNDSFFEIMITNFSKCGELHKKDYLNLLKIHHQRVFDLNKTKFIDLISILQIVDIIEICSLIQDSEMQIKIFEMIINDGKEELIEGDAQLLYFKLICQFRPEKIIEFLETKKYDVDRVLQISKDLGGKRAIAFLEYKMGKVFSALEIYQKHIEELWNNVKNKDEEIFEIFLDIKNFKLDDQDTKKVILKSLIFFANLKKRISLKKKIIISFFKELNKYDISNLISDLEKSNDLHFFLENSLLASSLILDFEHITDYFMIRNNIFEDFNYDTKNKYLEFFHWGNKIEEVKCKICDKLIYLNCQPRDKFVFHSCRNIFHQNCFTMKNLELQKCLFCIKNQTLELANKNKNIQKIRKTNLPTNPKNSISSKGRDEFLYRMEIVKIFIFEKIKLKNNKKVFNLNFKEEKRGLSNLEINLYYFDL